MEHLAIMKKSLGLLPKILSGEKRIESRWYSSRRAPIGKISPKETVYFKNSGEPVSASAQVEKVLEFSYLDNGKIGEIAGKYFREIGFSSKNKLFDFAKGKRHAVLVFLKSPREVKPPFEIDKRGFGARSAWLSAERLPRK